MSNILRLRDNPYRNEDGLLVLPLADGTNLLCYGDYPLDIRWEGLDYDTSESATIEMKQRYSSTPYGKNNED